MAPARQLIIVRHGQAALQAGPDELRPLTAAGEAECQTMRQAGISELRQLDAVLVSPYLRAQQTAALLCAELPLALHTCDWLTPEADARTAAMQLEQLPGRLLVVSHMPFVALLCRWLCHGDLHCGPQDGFYTAQWQCLQGDYWAPGTAQTVWRRTPQQLGTE